MDLLCRKWCFRIFMYSEMLKHNNLPNALPKGYNFCIYVCIYIYIYIHTCNAFNTFFKEIKHTWNSGKITRTQKTAGFCLEMVQRETPQHRFVILITTSFTLHHMHIHHSTTENLGEFFFFFLVNIIGFHFCFCKSRSMSYLFFSCCFDKKQVKGERA